MFVQKKPVYTLKFDAARGETPDLLMTAIALAVFDLAPLLDEDNGDLQVLTASEAQKRVLNGREVSMALVDGRMCFAHIIATRLSRTEAEITLAMYDRDGDMLMRCVDRRMNELVEEASNEMFIDLHDLIGDDADTHEIPIEFFLENEDDVDAEFCRLAAVG